MNDSDGYRMEAAEQFGFETTNDDADEYKCTQAALIAFAKACERKGMADARAVAKAAGAYVAVARVNKQIAAIDAELAPILAAEEIRYMTSRGYVRGTDEPGKRWIKSEPLCDDEGCPQHGTPHVCINRTEPV
jgi:hypothetical protein